MDINEMIDELAQYRTELADIPELESSFYDNQYEKLEMMDEKDILEAYKTEIENKSI